MILEYYLMCITITYFVFSRVTKWRLLFVYNNINNDIIISYELKKTIVCIFKRIPVIGV